MKQLSARLLSLRDAAKGPWKEELQLAMDAAFVEDNLDLARSLGQSKETKPVQYECGLYQSDPDAIIFSPDGKHMASVGHELRIWNTADWTLAAKVRQAVDADWAMFSQDSESIYVVDRGIVRRVRWRDGRVEHVFDGQKNVTSVDMSADQKLLVTSSYYDDVQKLWDVPTGKVVRSYKTSVHASHVLLRPDGKLLMRQESPGRWLAESLSDGTTTRLDFVGQLAGFSPDGDLLYTIERDTGDHERDAAKFPDDRSVPDEYKDVVIRIHKAAGDFARLPQQSVHLDARAVAISPDGKRLAAFGGNQAGRAITVLSLSDLRVTATCDTPAQMGRVKSLAFSRDGKILAVTREFKPLMLFSAESGDRIMVGPGNQGEIERVAFSADGKTLRTFDRDGFVCIYDPATMRVLRRFSLPRDHYVVSARPSDARFVICAAANDPKRSAKIVDVETGMVSSEVRLATGDDGDADIIWINDTEAFSAGGGRWLRFNYQTGNILRNGSIAGVGGDVTEDGKSTFAVRQSKDQYNVATLDLQAMKWTDLGSIRPMREPAFGFGQLIPGGKYFSIGTQIYDRRSLKLVAAKDFGAVDQSSIRFIADGTRYAVVTSPPKSPDYRQWDSGHPDLVLIVQTLSGKILAAFPTVGALALSPDGSRLAVYGGSSIEIWPLK